jgi:glyoxylase-like metal-dependent hydrolase (beta-lactamase superfamily II)
VREIDVEHLGTPGVICCHEVDGCLVDPGPESSHRTLLAAWGEEPPRAILLTHIHFDHAGAAGRLVERWPDVEVWVHERGAPHLADPRRLVRSAKLLYGEDFGRLWGEVVPVPEANLRVLEGGDVGELEGPAPEGFRVAYTPGHASHHVSYLHEASGTALTGDVAGTRNGDGPIMPPTPPPDIDLELWDASIDVLEAWRPQRLALTHFGSFGDAECHLAVMREALHLWGELARHTDADAYAQAVARRFAQAPGAAARAQSTPPETLWPGLHRYCPAPRDRTPAWAAPGT